MNRYKEFAEIYDNLINEDVDYKKWAQAILKICDEFGVNKINYLDLACGTGNMTKELAGNFKESWAVDLSEEMLTEAEEKFRKQGIRCKLVCQDISELNLNKRFDVITCCLDSTNYILEEEGLRSYFHKVNLHIKDEGIFIFDVNSYYKITKVLGNNIYNYDSDDIVYIWENNLQDEIVDMYLTFFIKTGENYKRFDEQHSERAYSEEYLRSMLESEGFKILKKLDNYNENEPDSFSERIVYVVKKAYNG